MPVKVKLDARTLRNLRKASPEVLRDVAPIVRSHAQVTLAAAQTSVPRESGGLAQSAFVDGPQRNEGHESVSATAGYAHHAAGAIHEGFHFGVKNIRPEPHWLRKAARKARRAFTKAVAAQIPQTLARVFGQ